MIKDITFQHIRSMVSVLGRHVVGVIDSLQEGEQAAQALEDVGYKAEDIALIPEVKISLQLSWRACRGEGFFYELCVAYKLRQMMHLQSLASTRQPHDGGTRSLLSMYHSMSKLMV